MTSDPFDDRCDNCGTPLLAPGVCDRDDCRPWSPLTALRDAFTTLGRGIVRVLHKTGIVE